MAARTRFWSCEGSTRCGLLMWSRGGVQTTHSQLSVISRAGALRFSRFGRRDQDAGGADFKAAVNFRSSRRKQEIDDDSRSKPTGAEEKKKNGPGDVGRKDSDGQRREMTPKSSLAAVRPAMRNQSHFSLAE